MAASILMKLSTTRVLIMVLVALQLFVMLAILDDPLHGPFDSWYRNRERMNVFREWKLRPTPTAKAAYNDEMRRLDLYLGVRGAVIVLVLVVEGVGVHALWNRKTTAFG
jgi:hypothetical protein